MNTKNNIQKLAIYQAKNGAIKLHQDFDKETFWASLDQIAFLFGRDKSVISRHISNILKEKELKESSVVAKNAITATDGKKYQVSFYNLDMILSIGYRVNSKVATQFRIWATKILKQHITTGFTINLNRLKQNKEDFLKAVEDIKLLSKDNFQVKTDDILELIKSFSYTWFSLDKYDKSSFPKTGIKKNISITTEELNKNLFKLKKELINKGEANNMFAQEKTAGNLEGIIGNVFQAIFSQDIYNTIEEKAAHLLYFIIKDHPFNDGNKRSGAFTFIWFLNKAKFNFRDRINPESLATLTILIAESNPKDKERMIGIILLLLNFKK
ncbi:MAG TPA: virulence protein RhuM/Fic/DOC family protein [bacterium]|nr:virulence protein RhuM/Fic/DOC family protein [bacterium]